MAAPKTARSTIVINLLSRISLLVFSDRFRRALLYSEPIN